MVREEQSWLELIEVEQLKGLEFLKTSMPTEQEQDLALEHLGPMLWRAKDRKCYMHKEPEFLRI
jgi:hypothetical protein